MWVEAISDWLFNMDSNGLKGSSLHWVDGVKAILEEEMECVHSIQSLSKRVFVHPVYLSGAFKKQTGCTVGEYQKKMKLNHSMHLLLRTTLPVNDIAMRCGFFDNAHFGHSFKSVYGISPGKIPASPRKLIGYNTVKIHSGIFVQSRPNETKISCFLHPVIVFKHMAYMRLGSRCHQRQCPF
jgi:AraC-like DNA-binding protein